MTPILEITIQRRSGDRWPVVVEQRRAGSGLPVRREGELALDPGELNPRLRPLEYGTILGRALFHGPARDAFVGISDEGPRVLLSVEAEELRTLHWQRLCAPGPRGWDHLTLVQRMPFALYLASAADHRFPPIGPRDLRALVVVASPAGLNEWGLTPFDAEAAVSGVRAALGAIPCDVLASTPGAIGPPTLDALCEQLTRERYSLLHLMAHGKYVAPEDAAGIGETLLFLESSEPEAPDYQVEDVPASRLIRRLGRHDPSRGLPYLVFLAACDSAAPEAEAAPGEGGEDDPGRGGLAQRLVREVGVPAALAMTDKVTIPTAMALAESFYKRLRELGEVDRALGEATAGLAERDDIIVPALYSRLADRPLFSDDLERPLTDAEIEAGLAALSPLVSERAPVLERHFAEQAHVLRRYLGTDVAALNEQSRGERAVALSATDNLAGEVIELSFPALARGRTPPAYEARCPFRGTEPFRADDAQWFCGRSALVERLAEKLRRENFLTLSGPAGCGKSSLVLAGLLPALAEREGDLQTIILTPSDEATTRLDTSIAEGGDRPAVLVVDQLERLFLLGLGEEEEGRYLGRLLELAEGGSGIRVVVILRDGRRPDSAVDAGFAAALDERGERLAPLAGGELRAAVEEQAGRAGLRFEAELAGTLLDDLGKEPGAMALLQIVLGELWQRRHGRWLCLAEYRGKGGARQALGAVIDAAAERLRRGESALEQRHLRDLVLRLIRVDTSPERRHTRRRVRLSELVPAGRSAATTRNLVARLADARLVVGHLGEASGEEEVELAHDLVPRAWKRLQRWLGDDVLLELLEMCQGLRRAERQWRASPAAERPSRVVHRGGRLADLEARVRRRELVLNAWEEAYVEACVEQRQAEQARRQKQLETEKQLRREAEGRQRAERRRVEQARQAARRLRWRAAVAFVTAIVAGVFGAVTLSELWLTEDTLRISLARDMAAQSLDERDNRLDAAALLAVESRKIFEQHPEVGDIRGRHSLLAAITHQPRLERFLHGHRNWVNAVAVSPDGATLASGSGDGAVILWQLATASGGEDGAILLWDVERGQPRARLVEHGGPVTSLAWRPGSRLASGGEDGSVLVWDDERVGKRLTEHRGVATALAWSAGGGTLASGGSGGLLLWHSATDTVRELSSGSTSSVAWGPGGEVLASGEAPNGIAYWNVEAGELRAWLTGHKSGTPEVAVSADGRILASSSRGEPVRLTDLDSLRSIGVLRGSDDPLLAATSNLAFSPDGRTLAFGAAENRVVLWKVDLASWRRRACELANRDLTRQEWQAVLGSGTPYRRTCPELPATTPESGTGPG